MVLCDCICTRISWNRGAHHADIIVYIFAHLHTTLRTEGSMLDTGGLQVAKELVKLNTR